MKPRILFIVPADYESMCRKGVQQMFFERVITIHPFTKRSRVIRLNDTHVIYEVGQSRQNDLNSWKIIKYPRILLHFLRTITLAVSLIKSERIHLIRANDPYLCGLFAGIAASLTGTPFCVSIHSDFDKRFELDGGKGAPTFFGSRRLARTLGRLVFSRANLVMPIRESLGDWAVSNGADAGKIRVIPHGIDLSYFQKPANANLRKIFKLNNLQIISFVGRLSRENYVDDILVLARKLSAKLANFVFVMAGGGNEEERLKELVAGDPVLKKTIRLLGFQPREICLELRRVSTVSLCLMGGFSLIEACAGGNPVISYDVEWHSELVKNGETGFLVKEGDIDALCEKIEFIFEHPAEARRMGENARNLAFLKHNIENSSAIKRKVYLELLNGRKCSTN